MGVALQAWNGTADWTEGQQFRAMRAMFPMYDTPFTFAATKGSAIRTLADMTGKRIGVGPKGGTAGTYVPQILATLKIDAALAFGSYDDLAAQLRDGKIDVLAAAAGAPFPALAALDAEKKVRFIPLSRDDTVALRLAMPELTPATIPAGLYPSMMTDYQTVGLYNFAVVNKNLPNDLVYAIVDAVFTNRDELVAAHPAAAATVPANYSHNTFLPYHPGAMQYYARLAATGAMPSD
jgi:TRAP transporter TAXI family solute receptor